MDQLSLQVKIENLDWNRYAAAVEVFCISTLKYTYTKINDHNPSEVLCRA